MSELEILIDQIEYIHEVTVQQNSMSFVFPAVREKNSNGPKHPKYLCNGRWTPKMHEDIDFVVQNCPEKSKKVATAVIDFLKYVEENTLPSLERKSNFGINKVLKLVSACLARCCVADAIDPEVGLEVERAFAKINYDEQPFSDTLKASAAICCRAQISSNGSSPQLWEEAMWAAASAIFKVWTRSFKQNEQARLGKKEKLSSIMGFVAAWKFAARKFATEPIHEKRDVQIHHVRDCSRGVETVAGIHTDGTLLYSINTSPQTITEDYLFKMLFELLMSPHINVEWKIPLCKFMEKDAAEMLASFVQDISRSATDVVEMTEDSSMCEYGSRTIDVCRTLYGSKFNPSRIVPIASNFWDFCRGGHSPSDVRHCMLFDEPSCNPKLSSGAGLFGKFTGFDNEIFLNAARQVDEERKGEVDSIVESLLTLVGLHSRHDTVKKISTRRWREDGSVVCFNFCPLTIAGAILGYGKLKLKNCCWVKTIRKAILDARARKRNYTDWLSRTSDLLSDAGNVSLNTVVFGCLEELKAVSGIGGTFTIKVGFKEPIQTNAHGSHFLYAAQKEISHGFPNIL
nr:MAG: wsv427-like protein [Metapenaeus ensis nimavirus]